MGALGPPSAGPSGHRCSTAPGARKLPPASALLALRPPPLDGADHAVFLTAALAPQLGEARVLRGRPLGFLEVIERHADRDRHALAADDALAVAQRRDRIEEAAGAFGHRRL